MNRLRVGLDLDGSLASLGDSMVDLADALEATGLCELTRFRTAQARREAREVRLAGRALWAPLWRRGRGIAIDALLEPLDVLHVAGLATPPTKSTPLVISLDDLRPLRDEAGGEQRRTQLRRAVARGAVLVASSATARHEVLASLAAERPNVVVVSPAVPRVEATIGGEDLVVNLAGAYERFTAAAPHLSAIARANGARVVVLTSAAVAQRVRDGALRDQVIVRPRAQARDALAHARVVVHLSDGARFPSFAIAALAAGVPTLARATRANRELLSGAAALYGDDDELVAVLGEVWTNEARRAIMIAAGRDRARDFAPAQVARAYVALYREVVQGWRS